MLAALMRTGLRRGLVGGNRTWLAVGVAAAGLRLLGRIARQQPDVVYCEPLEPGLSVLITHQPRKRP
ncbi:MAG: hypothetical protein ACRD0M_12045 [Acidimicrobiales bacterium]